jgi:methylated-DNA-[protein]-cysteine S-methyltransferase
VKAQHEVMPIASLDTPIGPLSVEEHDGAITRIGWVRQGRDHSPLLTKALAQLGDYFDGRRTEFDLPLRVEGSSFQKSVCDAMLAIPLGETRTYGDIAKDLGVSPQAVGSACGHNPIPVIIPCHRVMGADGKLTGFSGMGGVETKVALLRHEKAAGLLI